MVYLRLLRVRVPNQVRDNPKLLRLLQPLIGAARVPTRLLRETLLRDLFHRMAVDWNHAHPRPLPDPVPRHAPKLYRSFRVPAVHQRHINTAGGVRGT